MATDRMEQLVGLCKRRGFIFQSSEIYGGLNGFWDYGPLGVELKRNVKEAWWQEMVTSRDDIVGLDSTIIMNPAVWEASGHVTGFSDPMVDCRNCKTRFRADQIVVATLTLTGQGAAQTLTVSGLGGNDSTETVLQDLAGRLKKLAKKHRITAPDIAPEMLQNFMDYPDKSTVSCPVCGATGSLTEARQFNLLFKTYVGALEDSSSIAYLRPETAQGIFVNFKNVLDTSRMRLPFGIAQIGKAFRNEINPRNFTFRSREFEQMEVEFFCHPSEADKWYEYWRDVRFQWYVRLGLRSDRLRLREHEDSELAHYAKACADVEYAFPFGVNELEGIANRTDFDLKQHQQHSGKDLSYFDDQSRERFIPYVIEPSAGVDRSVLAFLCEAFQEDEAPDEKGIPRKRTVMRLHPRLAPIKVAVFPLVNREGMPDKARAIYNDLKKQFACFYDEKGAIGRRYRRQDEAGTPFCVTVDGQTAVDQTVTIRDRDSLKQQRISCDAIADYLSEHLKTTT